MTIGLTPTGLETGYGYIECTDELVESGALGTAYWAARFIEKPNLAHAMEYLAASAYLWNAAIFGWRVDTLFTELGRQQPEILASVRRIADAWERPKWNGVGEMIEPDGLGNSVRDDLLRIDTTNSVIWSETGRMVAMVGLDNLIVVDTGDALLIIDRKNPSSCVEQLRRRQSRSTKWPWSLRQ